MSEIKIDFDFCPICGGSGTLRAKVKARQINGTPIDYMEIPMTCPTCHGKGKIKSSATAPSGRRIE